MESRGLEKLLVIKVLRRAFNDYERGDEIGSSAGHVHHCLDALRQDMMCNADDSPMPKEPERHAFYHRWSDYEGRVKNRMEMFAF
ncbi:uncharacterized protein EAF01_003841 [Botrytis porri]|uniref:uncharacterized protein n=1 Tax=Botrytis porri TaxID=87229 RepID=UPI001902B484|nr:uncharacterized protein EAF01_003841 [Botrytis porri]KAF7908086.1 hypothetical protein EAF01_003841 [Botrytis porri]